MRVDPSRPRPLQPAPAPARVAAPKAQTAAAPFKVITYNTGSDDSMKAPQGDFVKLPPFQDVINGKADAPIISCQEAGPELAKKLVALAKQTGNFDVVWTGDARLPNAVLDMSPIASQNLVLVPKRFQVEASQNTTYGGRLGQLWRSFTGWLSHKEPANDMLLAIQRRTFQTLRLKDSANGKEFSLINTHIAYDDRVRRSEEPQFVDAIEKAEKKGPVIVTGDFNTNSRDTNYRNDPNVEHFWQELDPAKLTDLGPAGKAGASLWESGRDIDHVLGHGVTSLSSRMLTGSEMSFPGRPDPKDLSDHYAEEDLVQLD
jgi:endonuclease/exonuclease/phosphatase family metal-dependent hydrolase